MNKRLLICGALLGGALATSSAFALEATDLSSFEGVEEPSVIYYPATDSFVTGDTYTNIVLADSGSHAFKFTLRYSGSGDWWDGSTTSTSIKDRGRAEVKGLGPHQASGETYDYISTWRTSSNWQDTNRFAHIFQLFAVNGSSSVDYVVQLTLEGSGNAGTLHYYPGGAKSGSNTVARSFTYSTNSYSTYKIEVKAASSGSVKLSIDGDSLSGASGVNTLVSGADGYRPKWGQYRGFSTGWNLGTEYIEHKHIQANKL